MDSIRQFYKDLEEYLTKVEVQVTETEHYDVFRWEDPNDPHYFGEEITYKDFYFNGLTPENFFRQLKKIISDIEISLHAEIEMDSLKSNPEIDGILNNICNKITTQNAFIFASGSHAKVGNHYIEKILQIVGEHKKRLNNSKYVAEEKKTKDVPRKLKENVPLRWNGEINQLVDIFYQLAFELKNRESESLIEASPENLKRFILNNFTDSKGNFLSQNTVQTYLKPGRDDKRPQLHNKILIKNIP